MTLHPADRLAFDRAMVTQPVWNRFNTARDALRLPDNVLLHAGPPFEEIAHVPAPILNSACVAAVYEELAPDFDQAEAMIRAGEILLKPAQDHDVVTPLAAVVSASMPLHAVYDAWRGEQRVFAPINGGNRPSLRLGLRSEAVLDHIRWLNTRVLDVLEQGFIVAPSAFGALDAGTYATQIGSGPYRLVSVGENEITALRVESHFSGRPANGEITWRRVPEAGDRLSLLETGQVEVANGLDFDASHRLGTMRHEYLSPVAIIYLLNAAKGALADGRVRRALSLAVDRDAIVQTVMAGAATPLHGFVSPNHYGVGQSAGATLDREEARRLLAAAGHGNGLTLDVDCPTRLPDEAERLTAALADQLADVGIDLNVHIHSEREAYAHMVRRKEIHDMCVFDSSPMSTYRVLYEKIDSRVAGSWWQGYANSQIETLIDQGRVTSDRATRAKTWQRAYALLQEDPAWLTLYNPIRVIGLAGNTPDFQMPADGVIDVARLPALGRNT